MLDYILKYISIATVAGAGISFAVGLVKYLDQRRREERTERFKIYHDLMRRIAGFNESAQGGLPLTQQAAAIYELQHFKDYAFVSVPILKYQLAFYKERQGEPILLTAMEATLKALGA